MIILSAALLIVTAQASPAEAQAIAQNFERTWDAYLKCSTLPGGALDKLPATVTPEEGAKIILKACAAERAAGRKAQDEMFGAVFPPRLAAKARANAVKSDNERSMALAIRSRRAQAALTQCNNSHIAKLDAAVAPEAGAATIFSACAAQRAAVLKNQLALLQAKQMDDEWSVAMIAQAKAQIANDPKEVAAAKEEIANMILRKRNGPPAPPAAN
jgi:hypothetical protein